MLLPAEFAIMAVALDSGQSRTQPKETYVDHKNVGGVSFY